MERIKDLNHYQKGIIIVMIIMALIFAVIYPKTISRVGYRYNDVILAPTQENGNTVYSGKIKGEQTQFIVSDDKTVMLQYGDKAYGPYTVKEDPTAIPKDQELNERMTGVEIYNGEKVLFRGGVLDFEDDYLFYNEDGTLETIGFIYVTGSGTEWDEEGNVVDKMEPSASTIYELVNDPELTHKGSVFGWLGAVFICILNVLSILFADELFRWNLLFRIRNVEDAEPSGLEMVGRYLGWTVMTIMAFGIFIVGLQ